MEPQGNGNVNVNGNGNATETPNTMVTETPNTMVTEVPNLMVTGVPEMHEMPNNNINEPAPEFTVKKPKKNNATLIGMICFAILAIGGIGFGVWAMLDGNARADKLNTQINDLRAQNGTLANQVAELQEKVNGYESESGSESEGEGESEGTDAYEILPPARGEAVVEVVDNNFTIKNAKGEIYMQSGDGTIAEIVSCDSGTAEAPAPLTCVARTLNGGEVKYIYNFDERSLEYIEAAE